MSESKLFKIKKIIEDRVDIPGSDKDFDGIFSQIMSMEYISRGKCDNFPRKNQTETEKRENAIAKFTNYAFYDLMGGRWDEEKVDPENFESVLKDRINSLAFGIRKELENSIDRIKKNYGYAVSITNLGDTSKTDWYAAQRIIVDLIDNHYGTVSVTTQS